ncbi:MAG TPA: hypothetical protein VLC09_00210 [Polyangiaceae bacterium]|nr:hypothetical protein [Polyangiaceae bacterium]
MLFPAHLPGNRCHARLPARMGDIRIHRHTPGQDISDFIAAGRAVFSGDPNWIPPLNLMLKDQLSPKSPFFQHAEVALFTATRDGQIAGRISAQIDREHLRRYDDGVGFFGFFETIDDVEVGRALLTEASAFLRARGMKTLRGPFSLSVNQEVGLLVDGFDTPPMVMMPHARPHQGRVAEACGLEKAKDLYAWRWNIGPDMPARCLKALRDMRELGVTFRSAQLDREIDQLVAIQDDAWRNNWGHVSMTPAEAKQLKTELSLIIDPSITVVVELDGEPVGMALAIPNLNEAIADFGGSISPAKIAKLLWRLKVDHPRSARVALLGIKEHVRKQRQYMPLALALIAELNRRGYQRGYQWAELSWTLEDNGPVNAMIRAAGGQIYKTYRIYERSL